VNPLVEAFIKKGFPSMQMKWYFRYKKWVKVRALPSYPLLSFKFFDQIGEEFKLS
jgi:ribonuclease G